MPPSAFHDLLEACAQPGCPICRLEGRSVERYIDNLFYESVNDIKTRDHLRASQGFCRDHARLALDRRLGDALGFAILYHDSINNILRDLGQDTGTASTSISALNPRKKCPVCTYREEMERLFLRTLIAGLADPALTDAVRSSDGLCVPHLRSAFQEVRGQGDYELLFAIHRAKLEDLRGELAEFIRKNDYRFTHEGFGAEGDSWRRAVEKLTGSRFGARE